jgi:hypothetical protein
MSFDIALGSRRAAILPTPQTVLIEDYLKAAYQSAGGGMEVEDTRITIS